MTTVLSLSINFQFLTAFTNVVIVGAHADGHQHGRDRKSRKTSGIHFCYKSQSDHSHEQVNIHINTSRKTLTVQIAKNYRIFFKAYMTAFSQPS